MTISRQVYVGRIVNNAVTDVRVGLVRDGDRLVLFFCGGAATVRTHTHWFRSAVHVAPDGDLPLPIALTNGAASAKITARSAHGAVGTLDLGDGVQLEWAARSVNASGYSGLYEAQLPAPGGTATVIATKTGNGRYELQGAFKDLAPGTELQQITPLRFVNGEIPGWLVDFPIGGQRTEIVVRPITP